MTDSLLTSAHSVSSALYSKVSVAVGGSTWPVEAERWNVREMDGSKQHVCVLVLKRAALLLHLLLYEGSAYPAIRNR